jgi:hypothetical protein
MTICIGATCASSKTAIVASDRMITTGDLTIAFEHDVSKITQLTANCLALTAGAALIHTDLFRNVMRNIHAGATPPISEIVEKVKDEYLKIRNRVVEEEYFKVRGYDIKWFTENQRALNPEVALRLDHELERYKLNLNILIAGVDGVGAHLYYIYPPCSSQCFEALGYCGMGTGERHAESTFISYRYTPSFPLKTALYVTYEAKRRAEIAVGVGENTDMAIISRAGIQFLKPEILDTLKKIYEKRIEEQTLKNQEINSMIEKLPVSDGETP